jgi:agmatinase
MHDTNDTNGFGLG